MLVSNMSGEPTSESLSEAKGKYAHILARETFVLDDFPCRALSGERWQPVGPENL